MALSWALRRLRRHLPEARRILEREGWDRDRLSRIDFPEQGVLDPYRRYHHGDISPAPPAMPSAFSTMLLPLLSGESIRAALASFRRLRLEHDADLLAHVLTLRKFSRSDADFLHGCRLLEDRAPGRRQALATLLARSVVLSRRAELIDREDIDRLDRASDSNYGHRVWSLLDAIERGMSNLHSSAKTGADAVYEIEKVIAGDWWDDGAWDFDVGKTPALATPGRSRAIQKR